jgi:putative protein-disulfide isomerase
VKPNIRLFYIHDPMCSWCYAFVPSWIALQQALPAEIQVSYLLGGLAPDTIEPMPLATREMVQQAWRQIEKTVPGVRFNFDFWQENTPIRSTYPACRAVLAAKKQNVACEQKMIAAIQAAYYQKARNPSLSETLQKCAGEIGLDTEMFLQDLNSPEINNELLHEIQLVRSMKVYSFPSLRLMQDDKSFPITVDYHDHLKMAHEIIQKIKNS